MAEATVQPPAAGRSKAGLAVAAAALAALATAAGHRVDFWLLHLRSAALDADVNWSLSDTLSFAAILCAAGAVAALALRERSAGLALLGGLLACFAVDDAVQLHLRLGPEWEALYLPLLLPALILLARLSRLADTKAGWLVRAGAAALGASVVLGAAGRALPLAGWGRGAWEYPLKVAVKQGAELAGWVLVAIGASMVVAVRAQALRRLRPHRPPAPGGREGEPTT